MNLEDLSDLNASLLCDAAERVHGSVAIHSQIMRGLRPIRHQRAAVGLAYTIRLTKAVDLDGGERARVMGTYDSVPSSSVVVIQVAGQVGGGVVGDVVAARFAKLGVRGAVVDGPIRDVLGIEANGGLPVWSREVTMAGMVPSEVRVEVGVELSVGGVIVRPGDLVAADMDGIFVAPAADAQQLVKLAREFLESERVTHSGIAAGKTIVDAYPSKSKHPVSES